MKQLMSRNRYLYTFFLLAILALSSGAGIKWNG